MTSYWLSSKHSRMRATRSTRTGQRAIKSNCYLLLWLGVLERKTTIGNVRGKTVVGRVGREQKTAVRTLVAGNSNRQCLSPIIAR